MPAEDAQAGFDMLMKAGAGKNYVEAQENLPRAGAKLGKVA